MVHGVWSVNLHKGREGAHPLSLNLGLEHRNFLCLRFHQLYQTTSHDNVLHPLFPVGLRGENAWGGGTLVCVCVCVVCVWHVCVACVGVCVACVCGVCVVSVFVCLGWSMSMNTTPTNPPEKLYA